MITDKTEEELFKISDNMLGQLADMKKATTKKKLKLIGRSILILTLVAGGVAVSVVFPIPAVFAVLGGLVAILDGGRATVKEIKKVKNKSVERKVAKEDLKMVSSELTKRKNVREFIEQQTQRPSAPPLYPELT